MQKLFPFIESQASENHVQKLFPFIESQSSKNHVQKLFPFIERSLHNLIKHIKIRINIYFSECLFIIVMFRSDITQYSSFDVSSPVFQGK